MLTPIDQLKALPFEAYLVGGCVRDMALKREPKDFDYVVVGETPEAMIELGFEQVAKSFPVFLHKQIDAEFALARKERSTGPGYGDFEFVWDDVTLAEDLFRRDLTMNAMALDRNGQLFDPYHGRDDIKNKVLRHISQHFVEDPLRIFRVARFAAQLGFDVAPETMRLMQDMAEIGLHTALSKERMTGELIKGLLSPNPAKFFQVLDEANVLKDWLPELTSMKDVPQRREYHAEGDVWTHNNMVLGEATELSEGLPHTSKLRIRLAALLHDIGKTRTPKELLWGADGVIGRHNNHDSEELMDEMFASLKERLLGMDGHVLAFAKQVAVIHQKIHRMKEISNRGIIRLYEQIGGKRAFTDPDYLNDLELACRADHLGRLVLDVNGVAHAPLLYLEGEMFKRAMNVVGSVVPGPIMQAEMAKSTDKAKGIEMGKEAVHRARFKAIAVGYRSQHPVVKQNQSKNAPGISM
ncbi:MAG: HD domain-containing protein [Hafnia sp.]